MDYQERHALISLLCGLAFEMDEGAERRLLDTGLIVDVDEYHTRLTHRGYAAAVGLVGERLRDYRPEEM